MIYIGALYTMTVGEGNGNPLQYSCLENPMDGGAWWAAVYGVTQSRTQLKQLSSSSSILWLWLLCQFSSVAQLCLPICDPMDCSMPGFPIHHQLLELAQTHVHRVGDAIQPSHPPFPFFSCLQTFPVSETFQMSQFFPLGGQSIGVSASVLPMNIQVWFPLGWTGLILQSKGFSRVFSNTAVQKHQFFGAQISL